MSGLKRLFLLGLLFFLGAWSWRDQLKGNSGGPIELNQVVVHSPPKWLRANRVQKIVDKIQGFLEWDIRKVQVRFFGDSIAIAYGAESRMAKDNNGKETKRCQVWTDTWLKRAGKWQIVAAQDTIVSCSP